MVKRILPAACLLQMALFHTACFETTAEGCEARELEDGSVVLVCGDDEPVTVSGPAGEAGEAGEPGEAGVSTTLRTEAATMEQCRYGGTVVFSGADEDGDGVLSASEEQGSFVVCQGVPGDATAPIIVPQDADPADCPMGGSRLNIGVDLDQSQTLEESEVTQSFVVCNGEVGESGLTSLVVVDVDGAQGCTGDLVRTGVDDDRSGTLEAGEVESSFEVCDGEDGLNPVLRVTEGGALGCANGGDLLAFGVDADDSGVLEDAEVTSTFEVCDGADGMGGGLDGIGSLIRLTPEPAGMNCADGGQLIETGLDDGDGGGTARNNTLEPGEIDNSAYVCDSGASGGNDGKNSLIRTSSEPPGANCTDGGIRLEVGLDADSSGALDDTEVDATQTQYICGGERIASVQSSLGGRHSCAVTLQGNVWCWGRNQSGQLGDGNTMVLEQPNPVKVQGVSDAISIQVGTSFSCALLASGGIKCWGDNTFGQLGNGTTTSSATAVDVSNITAATDLGAGHTHACATLANGTLRCWGRNDFGQLGDGTTVDRTAPVAVVGITDAVEIGGGRSFTCAISQSPRILSCWGINSFGQLGDGTTVDKLTPVAVGPLPGEPVIIEGGFAHTCTAITTGEVFCWGNNAVGQLGDGTTNSSSSPVQVIGVMGASSMGLGSGHSCASVNSGEVFCWGNNPVGQLGDGTNTDSLSPVSVFGLSAVDAIGGGDNHNCAVRFGGDLKCWGGNSAGELGNGTLTSSAVPVSVIF